MFKKILIANRGEIACRVIETAHKLGIRCVAVYSDADANSMHVAMADEAFHIGPAPSKDSYLRADKILEVAKKSGAEAVHPGYGFMSENPEFAKACADNNIVFIGPPVPAIEAMGSKSAAKDIMSKANVPLVPGYHGDNQDPAFLKQEANNIGYPMLLKAAFGGGGKGMRVVWQESEFDDALASAKREAINGFGNDTMLMEKYLTKPRHVEIQVFCDNHGNGIYLAERDCSIQRRHQKVIEEAPAPGLSQEIRTAMGEAAVRAAQAINYQGAGTVEFLYDEDGSFYFMEMNTRLQVEHPVTEMITGQDLVKWQLLVASGETLPLTQDEVTIEGHAFEVRVYAEDPENDFLPATGKLNYLRQPEQSQHVRVDTGVRENDEVSAFYDPMIAKLIVWDENRDRALQRMLRALDDYRISGVKTNLHFLSSLLEHPSFKDVELDTNFIEKHKDTLHAPAKQADTQALVMAVLYLLLNQAKCNRDSANDSFDPYSPWHGFTGWRMNENQQYKIQLTDEHNVEHFIAVEQVGTQFVITVDGTDITATGTLDDDHLKATIGGHNMNVLIAEKDNQITVFNKQNIVTFTNTLSSEIVVEDNAGQGGLTAPMNGTIVSVLVKQGDEVKAGQNLVIMEAMKMEYTITAPSDGKVEEVYFTDGDLVADGAELLSIAATEQANK
ncbi:acetyl-CoA carboxylase biotin carboxylase subunit [Flocculibacter collagenilyticus]|uniref:acetyl-CoA carboxylase biotin carboxylase subunit n=1 Tax=Flocculibacter collagenilyticus TaxID=2744479 RepID=UPI0018F4B979|nr:acetyl/propionyl/methylcrotonyl-CoA carboxylase subunit alpha [Flocculibacter collagenilyticus]